MPMSQLDTFAIEQPLIPTAANDNPSGFVAALGDQPIEGGFDPVFGDVTWQTLISGDKTQSNGVVLGVATFLPMASCTCIAIHHPNFTLASQVRGPSCWMGNPSKLFLGRPFLSLPMRNMV